MKFQFITISALLLSLPFVGQNVTWTLERTVKVDNQFVLVDQINNLYAVRKGEVLKLDPTGAELSRYSNKLIGSGVHVDVTNPMKVLFYSPDQMRLIVLDSRLGEIREPINLFKLGYNQISLAATSHSNCLWLYDAINFKLIRLTENLEEERASLNLAQMLRLELYPTDLIEMGSKVYLTDPKHGVFEFDIFANYIRKIPIKGVERLVVSDGRLFYMEEGRFTALNLTTGTTESVELPHQPQGPFSVNRDRIVLPSPNGADIYKAVR